MSSSQLDNNKVLKLKITPFGQPPPLAPTTSIRNLKRRQPTSVLDRIVSIRVVLICITLITVVALAIGLIMLSVQSSNSIVSTLSDEIQVGVSDRIIEQVYNLLNWAETESHSIRPVYQYIPHLQPHPNNTNPHIYYGMISQYMWSVVQKRPIGFTIEFISLDGRTWGGESFATDVPDKFFSDVYWNDYVNGSLYVEGWEWPTNRPTSQVNFTGDRLFSYPFGAPYWWISNPYARFGNVTNWCTHAPMWNDDLFIYIGLTATYEVLSQVVSICNSDNQHIGYVAMSIGISSIAALLADITSEIAGYIFIMDGQQRLVSTSTSSQIYTVFPDYSSVRHSIYDTEERWIQNVRDSMHGNYGEQSQTVHINGTTYYLQVTRYNHFVGVDWYIVKLFERDQFMGNSREYFVKGLIAAVAVSVAAIGVVMAVTWATTKPLFMLAADLQRMSRLDLEISDMSTPRLFEVGKVYRSVTSMYIALRSFKKFVPVQVISKIINSEREVTAELNAAKVTIMFQDIEGFTTMSERMDAMSLARLTSEYMEIMCEIICRHGGTIDKYVGDCIMSLFNAPEELRGHQAAATIAAAECIRTLVKKNVEWKKQYGCEMNCRIGINSGEVLIGNMGSEHRMNYTAFGDNVNVAARLEGVNKHFGTRIIVSRSVFQALPKNQFVTRKLAKVRVSGKASPTSIYEIRSETAASPATQGLFKSYAEALKLFKAKDLFAARDNIDRALHQDPTDVASALLKSRIVEAIESSPLPEDWNYIEDLLKH